jgi:hypothetical protein
MDQRSSIKPHSVILLAACLTLSLAGNLTVVHPASAAVELNSFTATPGNGEVILEWETASEIDLTSFVVHRGLSSGGRFDPISEEIPAQGFSHVGSTYSFIDNTVTNGVTYYYQLEALDSAALSEMFGPLAAIPISPVQSTSTAANSTLPSTQTTPSGNTTPALITEPALSALETEMPAQDAVLQDLAVTTILPSPTATLIPLPEITYQFPAAQSIATQTPIINLSATVKQSKLEKSNLELLALLGIFWMVLGGYFFFIMRRF